jgi:hypothetical protein
MCKHVLALAAFLYHKSVDPSCTEQACYWKKSSLSAVDVTMPLVKMHPNKSYSLYPSYYNEDGTFYKEVFSLVKHSGFPSMLVSQKEITLHPLCMYNFAFQFAIERNITVSKEYESFKNFIQDSWKKLTPDVMMNVRKGVCMFKKYTNNVTK